MVDFTIEEAGFDYTKLKSYSGYYIDEKTLLKAASGGAASILAESIINRGGVVFGVSYSKDFKRAEWRCIDRINDLDCIKGSKYCDTVKEIVTDCESKNLYSVIEEKIKEDRLVLFVGLGCEVAAVKAFCSNKKLDTDKLYTVEIICHGPTYSFVHEKYIEELEKSHGSKVVNFSSRYKKYGWTPVYIHVEFENGEIYETQFSGSEYHFAFTHYPKLGCYNCKFKGDNHKADIACGDYWGITESMSGWNKNGVSLILVQTPKGEELRQMIDENVYHIEGADTALALKNNPLYYKCRPKDMYYDKFARMIKKHGLHYAVEYYPIGFKKRTKKIIKKIVKSILPKK